MLREGTKTRDGEALALALQLLGTNVGAGVGGESGSISFQSTTDKFAPTLEILADMLVNPTFPAAALDRLRAQRLVQLAQANAQPGTIASRVYSRVLYGADHPFALTATETTVKAVTREDVVAFHSEYFKPGRAIVTVVGDVNAATVKGHAGQGPCRLDGGRREAGVQIPGATSRKGDRHLPGRQAWRGAIGREHRPAGSAAQHPGLHGARGDELHPRRPLPVAAQREHPRGEGLQLRRQLRLLVRQGPRSLHRQRRRRQRQDRRGAGRVHEGAARHPRWAGDHRRRDDDRARFTDPGPAGSLQLAVRRSGARS